MSQPPSLASPGLWWKRALGSCVATGLLLVAFMFLVGAVTRFEHPEAGGSSADWIVPGVIAVPCGVGGTAIAWRLRPPLTLDLLLRPSVQAVILYLVALGLMFVTGPFANVVAFFAFCAAPMDNNLSVGGGLGHSPLRRLDPDRGNGQRTIGG